MAEAERIYRQILAVQPDHFDSLHMLGLSYYQQGDYAQAVRQFGLALKVNPKDAFALNNRGAVLNKLGRFEESLASCDRALGLQPDYAEALSNRGISLYALRRLEEALQSYDKAIALRPDYAEALCNRGNVLKELRRFDEALVDYDRALVAQPTHAMALMNRGATLHELQRFDEALAAFDCALAARPSYAEALVNRGNTLYALQRVEEALASYDNAVTAKPNYAEAHYNLGSVFKEQGRWAEAITHFERAVVLKPNYTGAKVGLCMSQLPVLYHDEAEIAQRRAAYRACLEDLCHDAKQRKRSTTHEWVRAIGSSQPFFLACQGHNDFELQSQYGSLTCQIMAKQYPAVRLPARPRSNELVRLGIVSGFFRDHTVWRILINGWLSQIDREQFQIFGYYTGSVADDVTKQAAALCDRFVQGPLSIDRWRQTILDDAVHILIYPEVGMDPTSAMLAAQRLAAVQCNSWGHPDTSGFPTLDYFLSSELMEPPEAQDHYSERLIRLPNLSIYYEPTDVPAVPLTPSELGLRSTAVQYWCGQSLFKYLPQFDQVFPRIAREVGDCQFVFIQYQKGNYVTDLFRKRLDEAFTRAALNSADHCVFLPRSSRGRFIAASGLCDIVLDSIGWSGGHTTLESIQHELPIVTLKGELMRGRHTTAMLTMMGVKETVVETLDDYVAVAVRLGRDERWRTAIRNEMSEKKHRIYRDRSCVSALQQFLSSASRGELVASDRHPARAS